MLILLLLPCLVRSQLTIAPTVTYSQCPCVPVPGTGECLPYDERIQAVNLEDALVSFPDLSINDPPPPVDTYRKPAPLGGVGGSGEYGEHCLSEQCEVCQLQLRRRLSQIGFNLTTPQDNSTLNQSIACDRYRFGRNETGIRMLSLTKAWHEESDSSSEDDSDEDDGVEGARRRSKRQKPRTTGVVGKRYPISCTTKGVSAGENGLLVLCSSCWTWRRLPSNYFPQFINELVCDNSDTACLSGYASCEVGVRTVQVIRNDSGVISMVNLQGGSYCECRVRRLPLSSEAIVFVKTAAVVIAVACIFLIKRRFLPNKASYPN